MKAAIYIRVSTDEQASDGFSIEAQKRRLISYADSQDWDVAEVYIDDGWSAKDLKRPEMQRMIKDVEGRLFDVVLVYKLDRMTRSASDCDNLLKMFELHNVKFQSCTESFETRTATGRLFIRLVADIAQWERENTAERVRMGMEQMVIEGRRPGGPINFGYDKYERLVEEEIAQIRLVRKFYMEGDGIKAVAERMNEMGFIRRGYTWSAFSVWYVLDNPYYAGKLRYGTKKANGKYVSRKKEGVVPLTFGDGSQEKLFTWEEYQEHKAEMDRRSFTGFPQSREYCFSGVLICGKCGHKMSGRYHQNKRKDGSYNKIKSYMCGNRQMGKGCTMPMFRQELVENLIMDWINDISLDHKQLKQIAVTIEKSTEEREREFLVKELEKVKERKKKWQRMYADDLIDENELREHTRDELTNERTIVEQLKIMPETLNKEVTEPGDLLFELPDLWPLLNDKERHDLVLDIFKEIVLFTPVEKAQARKGKFIPASIEKITFN
ncbi:site-specific DNA recombinase [Paenibacillus sp. DS2015]|uniref:recombinase family protein n=1 Tax=Paenibacillus sp. DS2015 TaxID=3373917 RepID=UPI003D2173A8